MRSATCLPQVMHARNGGSPNKRAGHLGQADNLHGVVQARAGRHGALRPHSLGVAEAVLRRNADLSGLVLVQLHDCQVQALHDLVCAASQDWNTQLDVSAGPAGWTRGHMCAAMCCCMHARCASLFTHSTASRPCCQIRAQRSQLSACEEALPMSAGPGYSSAPEHDAGRFREPAAPASKKRAARDSEQPRVPVQVQILHQTGRGAAHPRRRPHAGAMRHAAEGTTCMSGWPSGGVAKWLRTRQGQEMKRSAPCGW